MLEFVAKPAAPLVEPAPVRLPLHANAEVHARIMADLKQMTPAEFLETLVQAGICTPDGKLTEHYAEGAEGPDAAE
jgi:hypothetical protein